MFENTTRVLDVNIDDILPNRFQPRIQFNEEEILELSDSIKEHGVIQPIVVRTIGDKYEIIAGERRYKASVLAGKTTIPVIIKNLNDKDSAEIALIENVQRKDLTPIEEAMSYKKILDMGNMTQEQLAEKLGKTQSTIANKIRLLNLSDEVQEALLENKISERHARSLLKLQTYKEQNDILMRIINERLTVRRTDEEIEKLKNGNVDLDDDSSDLQKIIEKGESDMNNNLGIPTAAMQPMPQAPVVEQPQVQPAQDIFRMSSQPVEAAPVSMPAVEPQPMPQAPVVEQPQVQPAQDIFSMPSQPVEAAPVSMPAVESQPMPQAPVVEQPSVPEFVVPELSPIVEQPQVEPTPDTENTNSEMTQKEEDLFSFGETEETTEQQEIVTPETNITEPIIVTDYSKQYDPVMPQSVENQEPKVEFKEVINAIRECSAKIEQYGFKIDVEEYDLANLYQVIFKVEK